MLTELPAASTISCSVMLQQGSYFNFCKISEVIKKNGNNSLKETLYLKKLGSKSTLQKKYLQGRNKTYVSLTLPPPIRQKNSFNKSIMGPGIYSPLKIFWLGEILLDIKSTYLATHSLSLPKANIVVWTYLKSNVCGVCIVNNWAKISVNHWFFYAVYRELKIHTPRVVRSFPSK